VSPNSEVETKGVFVEEISMLVAKVRNAQRVYETWSQEQVDIAVTAAGWAIIEPARNRELAELVRG
jgi:sulfoacetaldehyde dehydrogenase